MNQAAFIAQAFKHLPNGIKATKTGGVFSKAEMSRRLNNLRDHMAQDGIDACLFTSIHNINYYSGFLYCSFGRPYGLLVTHDTSTSISANIDYGQPHRRTFGNNLVYTDWQRDNFYRGVRELLQDPIKQAGTGGRALRLGIEEDHLTVERRSKLVNGVPEAADNLVDMGGPTMQMRMLKSAEEIKLISHGARIADIGGAACVEALQPGVSEYEVALHSTQTMVKEIAKTYPDVELMDTWTWFQSGPENTDGAHNPVTSRRVQNGDILSLNCFPMIAGYYTALERTLFMGDCTSEQRKVWEVNLEVYNRGLELIRPGARCCDIAKELNSIYEAHGMLQYRTFGYGHSFGTLSHYYGREAGLELREDITTELKPGMVVSIEPMLTLPLEHEAAGGYREHDILVVTEDGAENITTFPVGPERNVVQCRE